jgi:hypothetical protein
MYLLPKIFFVGLETRSENRKVAVSLEKQCGRRLAS